MFNSGDDGPHRHRCTHHLDPAYSCSTMKTVRDGCSTIHCVPRITWYMTRGQK